MRFPLLTITLYVAAQHIARAGRQPSAIGPAANESP
jgi:hypothetical protein